MFGAAREKEKKNLYSQWKDPPLIEAICIRTRFNQLQILVSERGRKVDQKQSYLRIRCDFFTETITNCIFKSLQIWNKKNEIQSRRVKINVPTDPESRLRVRWVCKFVLDSLQCVRYTGKTLGWPFLDDHILSCTRRTWAQWKHQQIHPPINTNLQLP